MSALSRDGMREPSSVHGLEYPSRICWSGSAKRTFESPGNRVPASVYRPLPNSSTPDTTSTTDRLVKLSARLLHD